MYTNVREGGEELPANHANERECRNRFLTEENEGNEGLKNPFQSPFSSLPSVKDFCDRFG
jgi:hypothetical protein